MAHIQTHEKLAKNQNDHAMMNEVPGLREPMVINSE